MDFRAIAKQIDIVEKARDEIDVLEKKLAVLREKRDDAIYKLRKEGLTGRQIEPYAGVNNVYVYRVEKRMDGNT